MFNPRQPREKGRSLPCAGRAPLVGKPLRDVRAEENLTRAGLRAPHPRSGRRGAAGARTAPDRKSVV